MVGVRVEVCAVREVEMKRRSGWFSDQQGLVAFYRLEGLLRDDVAISRGCLCMKQ